jgi:hypothetical protein
MSTKGLWVIRVNMKRISSPPRGEDKGEEERERAYFYYKWPRKKTREIMWVSSKGFLIVLG